MQCSVHGITIEIQPGIVRGAGRRIGLRVTDHILQHAGRTIHGAWDPLLRRIELFGLSGRSDAQVLATFLHELAHAFGVRDEAAADAWSRTAQAGLTEPVARRLTASLRESVRQSCPS